VAVALYPGAGESGAVDQRGVVEAVADHTVTATGQCGDGAEVGHVAGGEQQGARPAGEGGQFPFQRGVFGVVAADQVGGAAAAAAAGGGSGQRGGDARVTGEPEVVVAAEGEQVAAVDLEFRSGHAGDSTTATVKPFGLPAAQGRGEFAHAGSGALLSLAQALP